LGLGALSLRTLDAVRQFMGMVARTGMGRRLLSSAVGAGVCFILRVGRWLGFWSGLRGMGWIRLVAHRTV